MHNRLQDARNQTETRRTDDRISIKFDHAAPAGQLPGRGDAAQMPVIASAPARQRAPRISEPSDPCAMVHDHLVRSLGANRVRRYLSERTHMAILSDGTLELSAGDAFTLDMIHRRLGEPLRIAAQFALGTTEPTLTFRVDPSLQPEHTQARNDDAAPPKPGHPLATRIEQPRRTQQQPRCPRLEEFIVGVSNRLAFESVRRAVESNGPSAPVFVHGSCGVGKTHLLRGATMLARKLRPGCKVRYTTGEAFTNAFVTAIRTRTVDAFQKKYRGLDLLCIDDIHLMAGKQATQHEMLQIFNTLSLGGARIILASDAHPREIARLDQALSSRFSAGLVVRVDEPDPELAYRLVNIIAQKRGVMLDEAGVRMICDRVGVGRGASVRDLEGAVLQVQAVSRLLDRDQNGPSIVPTSGHVRQALALRNGEGEHVSRGPIALDLIIRLVCSELSVSKGDLQGKGRQKKVVLARELIVHLARQLTSKSFPEIAHELGRRNHSTVITAAKRFKDRLVDPQPIRVDSPFDGLPITELTQRLMTRVQQGV